MSIPTHAAPAQADARTRARRTFLQGLGVDVVVAIAVGLLAWLPAADITTTEAWIALAITLTKTVLTAVASYVARLTVPPAEPADAEHQDDDLGGVGIESGELTTEEEAAARGRALDLDESGEHRA